MKFRILLLDDNVKQAIHAVMEALAFGDMIGQKTSVANNIAKLPSLYLKLIPLEDESVSIVLFHNAKEIDSPPLVDDLVSEIKEKQMLFDLILIDDNWGDGEWYYYGQQKILPSLFSSTQWCHYSLFTQHSDQKHRIQAFSHLVQQGEYQGTGRIHFLNKEDAHNIYFLISRLIAEKRKRNEIERELSKATGFCNIVGKSSSMLDLYALINIVAPSDSSIIIRGASGTGKTLVAKSIHKLSRRREKPFITASCAGLAETLMEDELFGHEKGAFTGAGARREGRFKQADGGTIFLDEIGDFSLNTQVKLLRVLEEKRFERLGGTETITVDVRVIAATHRNLEKMIQEGKFREDLYYRLNVIEIPVPPLCKRRDDIPVLAQYFVDNLSSHNRPQLDSETLQALVAYHWPGNVRELRNCIERAIVLSKNSNIITIDHLPEHIRTYSGGSSAAANMINPDGKVAELYPDEELRAKARQYLERWEKACQQYSSNESITQKMIGAALGISDKAIIGTCKNYGEVMRAFLEEDLKRGALYFPLLLEKTGILTWKALRKSKTPDREKQDT